MSRIPVLRSTVHQLPHISSPIDDKTPGPSSQYHNDAFSMAQHRAINRLSNQQGYSAPPTYHDPIRTAKSSGYSSMKSEKPAKKGGSARPPDQFSTQDLMRKEQEILRLIAQKERELKEIRLGGSPIQTALIPDDPIIGQSLPQIQHTPKRNTRRSAQRSLSPQGRQFEAFPPIKQRYNHTNEHDERPLKGNQQSQITSNGYTNSSEEDPLNETYTINRLPAVDRPIKKSVRFGHDNSQDDYAEIRSEDALYNGLVQCRYCGRRFSEDRIEKHEGACAKANKKRKVMDPSQMRTKGTEFVKYQNKNLSSAEEAKIERVKNQKHNWKKKHDEFIRNIRYAKQVANAESNGKLSEMPPPPKSDYSSFVRCPHCDRNFDPDVAERHVPKCANIKNRPPPPRAAPRSGPRAPRMTSYNGSKRT